MYVCTCEQSGQRDNIFAKAWFIRAITNNSFNMYTRKLGKQLILESNIHLLRNTMQPFIILR
jgi:hypothetical protein